MRNEKNVNFTDSPEAAFIELHASGMDATLIQKIKSEKFKELCLSLLYAQTEEEVHEIVETNPLLSNPNNWLPYGGTYGNYSSFENQQSTPEGAFIEKVVNAIDATLTRQCLALSIHPSSKEAPQSMEEAKEKLYATKEELEKEEIHVITDGGTKNPNIIVVDKGEGQTPENFSKTFLSLQSGNKNSIKFVQGKFNMGSTGAVVFCGKHKYQLIISRRHEAIEGGENRKIGFTLVRKHVRTSEEMETMKNTWYEYFVIEGEIPHFEADEFKVVQNDANVMFTEGTIVKMFNYELRAKSNSYQHLRVAIDTLLYFPVIPIQVRETRYDARKNTMNFAYGAGNILRGGLKTTVDNTLEYKSEKNIVKHPLFGTAEVDIYLFKEDTKPSYNLESHVKKPIAFLMNGQVQYGEKASFIDNELGLKQIKDHLMVSVDCTNLKREFMDEGFFMANRENIRQNENTRKFMAEIVKFLKNHKELIELNSKRSSKKVSNRSTQDMIEKIFGNNERDTLLKSLFLPKSFGIETDKTTPIETKEDFSERDTETVEYKDFPSFFLLSNVEQDDKGTNVITTPLGQDTKITLTTDVQDDYFTRSDKSRGQFEIKIRQPFPTNQGNRSSSNGEKSDITDSFSIKRTALKDGKIRLSFNPVQQEINVGEQIEVTLTIQDEEGNYFEHLIRVDITEPVKEEPKSPRRKPKNKGLKLPELFQVYKDDATIEALSHSEEEKTTYETWASMGWDEEEGENRLVKIQAGDDTQPIAAIFVNMSSPVLAQIVSEEGTDHIQIQDMYQHFMMTLYKECFLTTSALYLIQKDQYEKSKTGDEDEGFQLDELKLEALVENVVMKTAYASVKLQLNLIKNIG